MCAEPNIIQGVPVSCRRCDECISTRKNDWVARCMAEKATVGNCMVINLTYRNNPNGTLPARAKAFHYADISAFLKRIRQAYYRKYKQRGEVKFLVAGERGSQKGRVHWHLLLLSKSPIDALGEFELCEAPGKLVTDLPLDNKTRLHWSLWEHGHVTMAEPDQSGVAYVVKYALKDMFNGVNSKRSKRYTKSENHGASYFRMSKHPPLGMAFAREQVERWRERQAVPPKLVLKIPGYRGYWWPKGKIREAMIEELHLVNAEIKEATGRDAPQWQTLLASLVDFEKDLEGLFYGEIETQSEEIEIQWWLAHLNERASDAAKRAAERQRLDAERAEPERRAFVEKHCSQITVCDRCLWQPGEKEFRDEYENWFRSQYRAYRAEAPECGFEEWYARKGRINPYCQNSINAAFYLPA